ncbi:MAG: fimbrillin family protein [Muribaculaceae bacterium]
MILFRPKSIALAVAVAALLLGNSSCNDDTPGDIDRLNGRIAFDINSSDFGGGAASRGGVSTATTAANTSRRDSLLGRVPFVAGTDTFMLSVSQSPNTSVIAQPRLDSRGAPIQDATMPEFTAVARTGENALFFKDKLTVDASGKAVTGRYWPNMPLYFFGYTASLGYAFDPDVQVSSGNCTGSFSYTMPAPTAENVDATKQPDLIVAITPNQSKQETAVPLRFHHALTAIVFKMGKVEEGTTIQSISLTNLRSSGDCTFAATGTDNVQFTWSNHAGKESYVQTVNKASVAQGDQLTEFETTFLVLPQAITAETAINVKFKIEGRGEYNLSCRLNPGGTDPTIISEFLPDTKYTFTLSLAEEIQVTVDDKVTGQKKHDVSIQNSGLAFGWIRAIINGYWVNKNTGVIVAPWKETDGTFVRASNWNTYWAKDPDTGIYYYKNVVPSGEFTEPLFDSYTLTATAPQVDAVLELNVAAQILIKIDSPDSRDKASWKKETDWATWPTL